MNDRQIEGILRCVYRFLDGIEGEGLDVGKPMSFERMIDYVGSHAPDVDRIEKDELRAVVAMCWLGPRAGIPPELLRQELLETIRDRVPEADERCSRTMEFVIAYGCGKFRRVFKGEGEWYERWPGAMQALQRALEPSVRKADRWLRRQAGVVGYPEKGNVDLSGEAWRLALSLIHPEAPLRLAESDLKIRSTDDGIELLTCDATVKSNHFDSVANGVKLVFTVVKADATLWLGEKDLLNLPTRSTVTIEPRDDETRITTQLNGHTKRARIRFWESAGVASPAVLSLWRCTCGNKRCAERHRLDGWDPNECRLWSFAASAVIGLKPSVQVGSFIAGMYFAILSREECGQRLQLKNLEYKICHHCSTFNSTQGANDRLQAWNGSLEADKEHAVEFEGLCCPYCRNLFDPTRSHRGTQERIIMTADFVRRYRPSLRIRCKNKKAHYRITAERVPFMTLSERWENLFTVPNSWSYENVRDARRAITDDDYLRIKMADPPAYLPTSIGNGIVSEKELRRRLKEWLRAPLAAACPLCGEDQPRRFVVVWERTFVVVKPLGSAIHSGHRNERHQENYREAAVAGLHAQGASEYEHQPYD